MKSMFESYGPLGVLFEYILVLVILLVINYIFFIRKKQKLDKKRVPIELNYLIRIYGLNVKKINYKKFVWIYNIINAFILSSVYIIVIYLVDGFALQLVFAMILLLLLTIICYGLLGRYYQKKGEKDVRNK